MRKTGWFLVTILLAALGSRASGQADPQTFFGGVHPRDLTYQPVNTNNLVTPLPRTGSSITLGGILSKFHIPGLKTGSSAPPGLPLPGAIPTGPYKNAFQPVQPIPAK
jgi:hypothetical protein